MKTRFLTALAAIGMVASLGGMAHAADIIEQPPVYVPPAPPVSTSGWYLRGDVGYNFKSNSEGSWKFWNQYEPPYRGVDDTYQYNSIKLGGSASFGGGLGYRFTDNFRMDGTLDYFRPGVSGQTQCPYQIRTDDSHKMYDPSLTCYYTDKSRANVWTAMANAYVDIGHYGRFTPYIGAGIGAAHVSYDDVSSQENCPDCQVPNYIRYSGTHPGESSWRFATALMAGTSVDLSQNLKFDVGYRYLHINGGRTAGYDAADRDPCTYGVCANGATGAQTRDNGFDIHTIKAGLRYEFGGGTGFGKAPAPVVGAPYAEPPVYSEPPIYK
ncbi:outer membrane protein [Jiella sp. M17.18]|uniref:outer membrane protein n=1 Tax=Jiella sp. M17.18 TaxID=3234247 RepID=UPI0034DDF541